jgi:hypothetical protein
MWMKTLIWVLFALLALLWTGAAAFAAAFVQWGAGLLAAGPGASFDDPAAFGALAAWLAGWLDPAAVRAVQEAALATAQALRDALPWIGAALGWLVPLIWGFWGLGVLLLLLVAGGSHWLAGRAPGRLRAA